jgi:hypothetical protein
VAVRPGKAVCDDAWGRGDGALHAEDGGAVTGERGAADAVAGGADGGLSDAADGTGAWVDRDDVVGAGAVELGDQPVPIGGPGDRREPNMRSPIVTLVRRCKPTPEGLTR